MDGSRVSGWILDLGLQASFSHTLVPLTTRYRRRTSQMGRRSLDPADISMERSLPALTPVWGFIVPSSLSVRMYSSDEPGYEGV